MRRAFFEGDLSAFRQQKNREFFRAPPFGRCFFGQIALEAGCFCETEPLQRAGGTARCATWQTDEGAQFHQGLVEVAGIFGQTNEQSVFDGTFRAVFQDVGGRGEEAHDDAQHVAVDGGAMLAEGDGGDGACRVATDAGQRKQIVEARGQLAAMIAADDSRGILQMARTAVVAEAFPELHQHVLIGLSERAHVGQRGDKALEVWLDRFDARLLQHDFGNPHAIWRGALAPRQAALFAVEPAQERHGDLVECFYVSQYVFG